MHKTKSGFTIVELLIVIVVIGILAAITIVAYNGIQQRSRNAQVIAGVNTYYKALQQYAVINGSYPTDAGCLGANYPSNHCWDHGSNNYNDVNAALDSKLATVMGSTKPVLATSMMWIGIGNYYRGGAYFGGTDRQITWYLSGASQNCSISGASGITEGGIVTQCSVVLPAV